MTIDNDWYDDLGKRWWDSGGVVRTLHEMNPARFSYFRSVLGSLSGLAVLDVGCGGGILAESFTRGGAIVFGLDRSHSSLQAAREHLRGSQSAWINGIGDQLPFSDSCFDVVVAADFLEHVTDLRRVIGECARVLKPRGYFLFDTINRTWQSRLVAIWLFERLFRIIPKNTHDPGLFIKPRELCELMAESGLEPGDVKGLTPRGGVCQTFWSLLRTGRVGEFRISDSKLVSYIGYGVRSAT